jgi:hypothetical protein
MAMWKSYHAGAIIEINSCCLKHKLKAKQLLREYNKNSEGNKWSR